MISRNNRHKILLETKTHLKTFLPQTDNHHSLPHLSYLILSKIINTLINSTLLVSK